jgi:hypothetical protein
MRKESGINRPGGGSSSKLITACANWLSIALHMLSTPLRNPISGSKIPTINVILREALAQSLNATTGCNHLPNTSAFGRLLPCLSPIRLRFGYLGIPQSLLESQNLLSSYAGLLPAQSQFKISYLSVCGAVHNPVVGTPIPLSPSRIPSFRFLPMSIYKSASLVLKNIKPYRLAVFYA